MSEQPKRERRAALGVVMDTASPQGYRVAMTLWLRVVVAAAVVLALPLIAAVAMMPQLLAFIARVFAS